jgi:hypothetical protein
MAGNTKTENKEPTNMKTLLFLFCMLTGISATAQSLPVKISADSVMLKKSGELQVWAYKLKIQNTGKELTNLVLKHRISLHHETGPQGEARSPLTFIEKKIAVPLLKAGATETNTTDGMEFVLDPALKVNAERDILKGIWVRLFTADGQEVGSFVKPASLAKKQPWQ